MFQQRKQKHYGFRHQEDHPGAEDSDEEGESTTQDAKKSSSKAKAAAGEIVNEVEETNKIVNEVESKDQAMEVDKWN